MSFSSPNRISRYNIRDVDSQLIFCQLGASRVIAAQGEQCAIISPAFCAVHIIFCLSTYEIVGAKWQLIFFGRECKTRKFFSSYNHATAKCCTFMRKVLMLGQMRTCVLCVCTDANHNESGVSLSCATLWFNVSHAGRLRINGPENIAQFKMQFSIFAN
jgi:hypothetical protein